MMVNTGLISALLAFHANDAHRRAATDIVVRQDDSSALDPSQFPSQCQSSCTTIISSLNGCTSESCICTSDNAKGMESCVNCLISIAPDSTSLKTEGQSLIDQFNTECASFNIPTITVSTGTSTSDSSASITGTSSGSHSTGSTHGTSTSSASQSSGSGMMTNNNSALGMKGGLTGVVAFSLVLVGTAAYML
ncbi:hypothetical protein K435DRAFT_778368 [Dendrothele bispora CBS 962.96]|uniref:Uncharacterized protein n=1 Tax=Dendrothele bispora (strain CBS 962.96) TaxID=1314807 RepID=A0A4S8M4D8_DENBC|nr:hypothetical protein K435DRAFT_778368 [Dendrothele bispora CBS 962.96]